jgi:hypothetical protein
VNHSSSLVSESPSGLDNANNQRDFLAEGLAGTGKSKLHNPVLPSEFDLFDPVPAVKHNWEFANENPAPLAKAMERPPQSCRREVLER